MIGDKHVQDWLPAYALGSLDPAEKALVDAHLQGCPLCASELQAYRAVADQLPLAVTLREPPPGLRQAILDRAGRAERQAPVSGRPVRAAPGFFGRLREALLAPIPAWGLVGAGLLAAVLLIANLFLFQQLATRPADTFHVIQLAGTSSAPQASAWVVVSADGRAGTLIAQGLPVLPAKEQYQLWLMKNGTRVNGGVFTVDQTGYASKWVYTKEPLIDFNQYGVTVEPQGGSPGPTGVKVLGGKK